MTKWKQRISHIIKDLADADAEAEAKKLRRLAYQIGNITASTSHSSYKTLEFMLKMLRQTDTVVKHASNYEQVRVITSLLGAHVQRRYEDKMWRQLKDKMRRLGILPALVCASNGQTAESAVLHSLRKAGFSKRGATYRLNTLYRYSILEDPYEDTSGWTITPPTTKLTREGKRLLEELGGTPNSG